jgi:hypothetical protein
MKTTTGIALSIIVVTGIFAITGCGKKTEPGPGVGERTGAALDEAAKKSAEKAEDVAEKVKDATGKAVEKAGETMEKAGAAVDKAGADLQK